MLPLTYKTIEEIATQWVDAPILKVDTLYDLEVWIMYTRYKRELPIYKFYFDDPEKHQLYISSKTGEVQQYTTRRQRFYAWIGAIPHKLYFPALRKHTPLWIRTITITSLIAFLVCLTGLIAGLYRYYRQYKKWDLHDSLPENCLEVAPRIWGMVLCFSYHLDLKRSYIAKKNTSVDRKDTYR